MINFSGNDGNEEKYSHEPNYSSYEDDPYLNVEPVFSDTPSISNAKLLEEIEKNKKLTKMKENLADTAKKSIVTRKVQGPLGNIIGNARAKTDQLRQDIEENDPIIAKLNKIEQMKKTGQIDDSVYTDLNKSTSTSFYRQRAQEFAANNVVKKIETDLERVLRLTKETRERSGGNSYTPSVSDKTVEIKEKIEASRNGQLFYKNNEKNKSTSIFRSKNIKLDSLNEDEYNRTKSIFNFQSTDQKLEMENVEKKSKNFNFKNKENEIRKLEKSIKLKLELLNEHRKKLKSKEKKVLNLIKENRTLPEDDKIVQILNQKYNEIEEKTNMFNQQQLELEKTLSDLGDILNNIRE